MYITKIKLKNVRCFDKLEIDFDKHGSSILILGDNGDGKSTVLKCLAMGLCDESSAAALFRELPGEFVRRQPGQEETRVGDVATIEIDLFGNDECTYRIVTKIKSLKTFERVFQDRTLWRFRGNKKEKLDQDTFPWEQIFVSGYGAGIRVQGTADFQHYLAVDAVYPLFRYDVALQNPELVIRRLVEAARGIRKDPTLKSENAEKVLNTVKHLLAHFLDLKDDDQIDLTPTGIKVKGHWGIAELGELGDGYRSKVTLVLDLLAWWFLKAQRKTRTNIKDVQGIVLLDEVEQHLHPRWQRTIIKSLQDAFPHIQLIATSHSPIVASGSESIAVHVLQHGQHRIVKPYGWLAEDVYEIMGLEESRSEVFRKDVLDRYSILDQKNNDDDLTEEEESEYYELKKDLSVMPESDPIKLLIEIENTTSELKDTKEKGK